MKEKFIVFNNIQELSVISIFYFCSATIKTERNKQTYRTIAEEKGKSNKTLNVIACTQ